ncbi:MAG: hypothetical protein GY896_06570 [Gammaproteobacteria bacterium]|nr:hypothetical protein [Gammaproteobacteria bacterium]
MLLLLMFGCGDSQQLSEKEPNVQEIVQTVTLASHGPTEASGSAIAKLLEEISSNPERYVPFLSNLLSLDRLKRGGRDAHLQAQNAASILLRFGGESGRSNAIEVLRDVLTEQQSIQHQQSIDISRLESDPDRRETLLERMRKNDVWIGRLTMIRNIILTELSELHDSGARDVVIDFLDMPDVGFKVIAVDYLLDTIPKDRRVRESIQKLFLDPTSGLHGNERVREYLAETKEIGEFGNRISTP